MKLGTRTRYLARAMLDLALNHENGNGLVTAKETGAHQQVSSKYLEHLLASLRPAGLVRSVRGAKGGHTLIRHAFEFSLRQIYRVFEGSEGLVECTPSLTSVIARMDS